MASDLEAIESFLELTTSGDYYERLAATHDILNALPGLLAELMALREVARAAARLTDMATMGGLQASWVGPLRALSASLDAVPNRKLTEAEASASAYCDAKGALVRALDALAKLRAHEVDRPWVYEWLDSACEETEATLESLDREYR